MFQSISLESQIKRDTAILRMLMFHSQSKRMNLQRKNSSSFSQELLMFVSGLLTQWINLDPIPWAPQLQYAVSEYMGVFCVDH